MGRTNGYRRGTRYMFAREYKKNGPFTLGSYGLVVKVGDIVDVKGTGAVQKGMPHKVYHGKTGVVYNVTKRGVGVRITKLHRQRVLTKHINVRIEHIKKSKCRQEFLDRVKENELKKKAAKEGGAVVLCKRQPQGPRPAHFISTRGNEPQELRVVPFEFCM